MQKSTSTRRTVLSVLGTGLAAGLAGTEATAERRQASQYVLVQGDECVPVTPLDNPRSVEKFYEYRLPEDQVTDENGAVVGDTAQYASAGTTDLQRAQTTITFLYRGPEGLSLVVVHGSVDASDAGSVTFRLSGLPDEGRWVVKDDLYQDPDSDEEESTNYDRWQVDGDTHQIDWTWGTAGTDGGAFNDLGDEFAVTIDPAFNEDAALYNEYYEGTVTDWQFLTGSADSPERVSLALDEPIRIASGSCENVSAPSEVESDPSSESDSGDEATDRSGATVLEDWEDGEWPADWTDETEGYAITEEALGGNYALMADGSLGWPNVRKPTVETPRGYAYFVRTVPGSDSATPTLLTNCQQGRTMQDNYAAWLRTGQDDLLLQVRSGGDGTNLESVEASESLSAGTQYVIVLYVGSDWVGARLFTADGTELAATGAHGDTTHSGGTPGLYTDGEEGDVGGTLYDEYAQVPLE